MIEIIRPGCRRQKRLMSAKKVFLAAMITAILGSCHGAPDTESHAASDAGPADDIECTGSNGYQFVCGLQNAEDLVAVPGTPWIITSAMVPGGGINLIDSRDKSWTNLYPNGARAEHDAETYASCSVTPEPGSFVSHGLSLRARENGLWTLYVVGHGAREAIEVFAVDASGTRPVLTWIGCVNMPDGLSANSVASFSDGSLVATVFSHPGSTMNEAIAGEPTGAVYEWSLGDGIFKKIEGTELPGNNGIEVSSDERELFVVSSGLRTIVTYEHSNPARQLRTTKTLAFMPDNLRMSSDGRLTTAGMVYDEPECGGPPSPANFDLQTFASCPRGFVAAAIDPQTMLTDELDVGSPHPDFSNATMALQLGNELWIGTFSGDRLAYRTLDRPDSP